MPERRRGRRDQHLADAALPDDEAAVLDWMTTVMAGVEEASAKLAKSGSVMFRGDRPLVRRESAAVPLSPVGERIDDRDIAALTEELHAQRTHLERLLASDQERDKASARSEECSATPALVVSQPRGNEHGNGAVPGGVARGAWGLERSGD